MNFSPPHTLEEMHKEYMSRTPTESTPNTNCGRKNIKFGNIKVLRPSKETIKKKPVKEENNLKNTEDDPELKEKKYEEMRAKLFTVEDNRSFDQCEEEEKKETAKEAPPTEEYDIDYDRHFPLFISQNNGTYSTQPTWQQNNPYYPPYFLQNYPQGYYGQQNDMGHGYPPTAYNQYYNPQY